MKCPNCKEITLVMSSRNDVEIDYCPECRGVWLDRGELDKIIERIKLQETPMTVQSSGQPVPLPNTQYQHKPYKRKKSFLEELFD